MNSKFFASAVIVVMLLAGVCSAQAEKKGIEEEEITIGVLARNGRAKAVKRWTATGEYLSAYTGRPVTIIPLAFKKILPAIERNTIDFFIVNPSIFVTAKIRYSAVPVVTMKSSGYDSFGAVIFTAAANKNIINKKDLKGKKFGAVARSSLGGWQIAQKEFADTGIDAYNFFSTLRFFETHSGVVKAVLNRKVHAGTVRTGTLERMAENGEIKMDAFRILEQKHYPDFPFVVSTALYPEWVLARTAATDREMANKVAEVLKYLSEGSKAAEDAQCTGWADPGDYSIVEEVQKQLKMGGYKKETGKDAVRK